MIARYVASFGSAAVVVLSLLLLMQAMIAIAPSALTASVAYRIVDFVRVEPRPAETEHRERPQRLTEPLQPPDRPPPSTSGYTGPGIGAVPPAPPTVSPGGPERFSMADGDLLPIVKIAPIYPRAAAERGLEGRVVVRFTVTRTGAVADATVIESSSTLFEKAALDAVLKWRYRPRVVNGEAVDVEGVRHLVTFDLEN